MGASLNTSHVKVTRVQFGPDFHVGFIFCGKQDFVGVRDAHQRARRLGNKAISDVKSLLLLKVNRFVGKHCPGTNVLDHNLNGVAVLVQPKAFEVTAIGGDLVEAARARDGLPCTTECLSFDQALAINTARGLRVSKRGSHRQQGCREGCQSNGRSEFHQGD